MLLTTWSVWILPSTNHMHAYANYVCYNSSAKCFIMAELEFLRRVPCLKLHLLRRRIPIFEMKFQVDIVFIGIWIEDWKQHG